MSSFILKYLLGWLTAKKQEQATLLKDSKWQKGGSCVPAVQGSKTPVSFPCSSLGHVSAPPCSKQSLGLSSNQSITARSDFDAVSKPAFRCFQIQQWVWHSLLGHLVGLLLLHETAGFPLLGFCSYQAPMDLPLGCCCVFWGLCKMDYQKYIPGHVSNNKPLSLW